MDDSCAVCAESLEWVAYGGCGHKDVCSTCVARLRFICDDRRCCICKTQNDVVFVTKALGDYTKTISDFALLPSEPREGRVGQYWYHEDTQAFFDDLDHYRMIKAMCKLSCSVCDNMESQPDDASRRRGKFRNIEQLKGHLFHKHRLIMCSLCLEGRKVFICEQKLYTRSQLTQHINTGDSEVDGTESERGGFMGHPACEFCRTPFYGDNELYTHMSTEHYTCHMCQRQHPGHYEYYKNYDDLEMHFRSGHFLCEDEGCLAKKFVVFQSEAELKRHNALEHAGRMSRAKRNAALQIPTSFRFSRSNEQDHRRGRGRFFRREPSDNDLSLAIQASLESSNGGSSSSTRAGPSRVDHTDIEELIPPVESLSTSDAEPSSKYLEAVSHRNAPLAESAFPPLAPAPARSQQDPVPDNLPKNTMAARLRRNGNRNRNASSSSQAWPAANRTPPQPATAAPHAWPAVNGLSGSSSSSSRQTKPAPEPAIAAAHAWPAVNGASGSGSASTSRPSANPGSSFAASVASSKKSGTKTQMSHSVSAPNLSIGSSNLDFPPVSAAQTRVPAANQAVIKAEDVRTANKSLVEKMHAALGYDDDKYAAFKEISGEYRQGLIDTETYLAYVEQFGLSHLILDLARLLPDPQKQKELIGIYNANQLNGAVKENGWGSDSRVKEGGSKKGKGKDKGKLVESSSNVSNSKNSLADNILSTVKELQLSFRPQEEVTEVLSKDGYRAAKGKSKVGVDDSRATLSEPESLSSNWGSDQNSSNGNGKGKPKKKTSKFHRVRLGDGSLESILDVQNTNPDPDPDPSPNPNEASSNVPVRGVWRNSGGQRLLTPTMKGPKN